MNGKLVRALSLFIGLIVIPSLLLAQGKITGVVLDRQSNEPLPAANVFIEGTNYGTSADLNGRFIIPNVPVGSHTLATTFIGYRKKNIQVNVVVGETVEVEIKLDFQSLEGEVVVVTAQAEGQIEAINQQLASNTIANIVSGARIKELPDVNAAESIGRLPGVAIQRSGGEATRIAVRGLSPKYNAVTVNGIRVPSVGDDRGVALSSPVTSRSGGDDRSVDLSLISSNIIDGIELKKALTPDMDADAIGGTVDLRLKEAPTGLSLNISAQSGYTRLQDDYGNYNLAGSASNRFLDDRLGIIATFNADDYNRSADKFSGTYRQQTTAGVREILPQNVTVREENVDRRRRGGSLLLDYRIPNGEITGSTFYNHLDWDGLYRVNRMSVDINRHYYDLEDRRGSTTIFTGAIGFNQDYDWLRYDMSAARTASRTRNPNEHIWTFAQENNAYDFSEIQITPDTPPTIIPTLATNDTFGTALSDMFIQNTNREGNETAVQLNVEMPFNVGPHINGYIKTGGKFRWLDRNNDEEREGRNGLHYGNNSGPNTILTSLDEAIPEWNVEELVDLYGALPISLFLSNYARNDFLDGDYPLGFTARQDMSGQAMRALRDAGEFRRNSVPSIGRDYDGKENYQAAYIMGELSLGKRIKIIPGIRWERDESTYHGQRFREVVLNNTEGDPIDLAFLTSKRENDFLLPMVHLQLKPTDWLMVRLARTESLTRPDFIQYAPITRINSNQSEINASNSALKPARSKNWDVAFSLFQNHVGLFTVSAFHKDIDNLIFYTRYRLQPGVPILPSADALNLPIGRDFNGDEEPDEPNWLTQSPWLNTFINNPDDAWYRGIELDWQTHFWYLPSLLRGLILNVNYTYIESEIERTKFYTIRELTPRPPLPPLVQYILADSTRSTRLPDQPKHIANITVGYDYMGFSARLSYLYQTNRVTSIDDLPVLDTFSGAYARWDLTFQQRIGKTGVQLFANFANLNNRPDRNLRGLALDDPTYIEYYGLTIDTGIRYRF